METALLKRLAVEQAKSKRLDPDLVLAICGVESAWNPWAVRYESGWRYFLDISAYAEVSGISSETERTLQAMSWGCMQVMGSVAREHGYRATLLMLATDPGIAMHLGVMHLAKLAARYGDDPATLAAAYNAGSPRKTRGGLWLNQGYVDKVITAMRRLQAKESAPNLSTGGT